MKGASGGSPALENLEDILRKAPDMGVFSTWGSLEGNLVCGGGLVYRGTLIDECRRAPGVGHLSAKDSMTGTLGEGSFTGEPRR